MVATPFVVALMRAIGILAAAFVAGAAITVGVIRGFEWWNDPIDNALRWGRV